VDPALIAIVGPTASGKSRLAQDLALAHQGEVVSCDSLQVYRGLDIGSAKPTPAERRQVPHHLIDVVNPGETFSAAEYARRGRQALLDIAERGRLPVVAGGTGLYLRALLFGLFEGPARDVRLRPRLEAIARRFGERRLHRLLARVDPEAARRLPPADRVRVVRALEVYWGTGRPLSEHHRKRPDPLEGFRVQVVGLDPGRPALARAVRERTRQMLARGLIAEVRALLTRGLDPGLRPLQAIGYRQAVAVVLGEMTAAEAEEAIVRATLQYAKRQMTWFRHQVDALWFSEPQGALSAVRTFLSA
jgi:tRNA dimethylallyltransferase